MANGKALCPNCENSVMCPTRGEYKCKALKRRIYGFTKLTECKHYKKRGKDFKESPCQCEDCRENEELRERGGGMNSCIKLNADNRYTAKLPVNVAMDFASYFIKHAIPALYECYGYDSNYRSIEFAQDAPNVNVMLAWIRSWENGHEYCPFCGGVAEVYETKEAYEHFGNKVTIPLTHIRCTKCQCMTNGVACVEDTEGVWSLWDKRSKK